LELRGSVVADNHTAGVALLNVVATLQGMLVSGTQSRPADGEDGEGVLAFGDPDSVDVATLTLHGSVLRNNREAGLGVFAGMSVSVSSCVIEGTTASANDTYGDGVLAVYVWDAPTVSLLSTHIDDSARAGISNHGARVTLDHMLITCSAFDLAGETYGGNDYVFEDGTGNLCGCPLGSAPCQAMSVGLSPPDAEPPVHQPAD
jgi:hypothetical protein